MSIRIVNNCVEIDNLSFDYKDFLIGCQKINLKDFMLFDGFDSSKDEVRFETNKEKPSFKVVDGNQRGLDGREEELLQAIIENKDNIIKEIERIIKERTDLANQKTLEEEKQVKINELEAFRKRIQYHNYYFNKEDFDVEILATEKARENLFKSYLLMAENETINWLSASDQLITFTKLEMLQVIATLQARDSKLYFAEAVIKTKIKDANTKVALAKINATNEFVADLQSANLSADLTFCINKILNS